MTTIQMIQHSEQPTAGVREQVPMTELPGFFSRAYRDTLAALRAQGVHPTGAPFGKYYGRPGAVVDVEAGFPVAAAIAPAGNVVSGTLPAGTVVEATHTGPYDTMTDTYAELDRYFSDAKLTSGSVMWESYLSGPDAEPDPTKWRTEICWPVDRD
ncbi:GyrI-like domain-containing protein [Arthrobacter sp. NPDC092385]|uniref:GyrI-like domain-containing protein n=1 Tax=Arthrobacter sp. NPDC092385 TaxID=3363943 RepID=UPI0037FA84F4